MRSTEKRLELALFERVKELTCLYSIARLASETGLSFGETMQRIAELLPSGWQFPGITSARIIVKGVSFSTPGFRLSRFRQRADIVAGGETCGEILIVYRGSKPASDEGPFLREERHLLNTVASEIGLIVERHLAEKDHAILTEQLRHADRLSTIGQLAAGVAHELNEPLAAILGLAQLSRKAADLPPQVVGDLDQIVKASLHAREVIRNLLLFARRIPGVRRAVLLNVIVEEALALIEPRREHSGIELVRVLEDGLPEIRADPAQIRQVLVNLLVNAVQAMSRGGTLEVRTGSETDHVFVAITDTGAGMSEDVLKQLFAPFFTTKDVGEGTGLGLAVASGIVSAHGGTVQVESEVGRGTRFDVRLPRAALFSGEPATDEIIH